VRFDLAQVVDGELTHPARGPPMAHGAVGGPQRAGLARSVHQARCRARRGIG
jgi:hypothetical protein